MFPFEAHLFHLRFDHFLPLHIRDCVVGVMVPLVNVVDVLLFTYPTMEFDERCKLLTVGETNDRASLCGAVYSAHLAFSASVLPRGMSSEFATAGAAMGRDGGTRGPGALVPKKPYLKSHGSKVSEVTLKYLLVLAS